MKVDISIFLKGRMAIPRSIIALVGKNGITVADLGWYLIFLSQTDFGHKYDSYERISRGDKVIAKQLELDQSTVNKKRKKLTDLGLLKKNGVISKISNYSIFDGKDKMVVKLLDYLINKGEIETVKEFYKNSDNFMQMMQKFCEIKKEAKLQNLEI